jgi:excisionase family DNA binding protein
MHQTDNTKLAYGIKEASAAINLSRAFLFEKIAAGELKSFKIANRRLIHAEDLASFINSYRNGAA